MSIVYTLSHVTIIIDDDHHHNDDGDDDGDEYSDEYGDEYSDEYLIAFNTQQDYIIFFWWWECDCFTTIVGLWWSLHLNVIIICWFTHAWFRGHSG